LGDFGGGLFVVSQGRLHGGDATYLYLGRCSDYDNSISAEVQVKHYRGPKNSIFGGLSTFKLLLKGVINSDSIIRLSGHVEGVPQLTITLSANKVSSLLPTDLEDETNE